LRKALETAQQKLSQYQREKGIVDAQDDHLDVENARLAELSSQLVAAQRAMYDAQSREHQLQGAIESQRLDEVPDVAANPLIQSLKAEIVRAEGKLADVGGRYERNHPLYQSAAGELAALKAKLERELDTARGSVVQSAQVARRQADEVQRALDRQKARVLELSRQRDILAVLTRDVESARAAYDAGMQRTTNVRLESRLDQTDIAVLNPAIAPIDPVFPKWPLNIAIALVLGTMFGCGTALMIEMPNRRVRSHEDLTELAGIAVLAEIGRIRPGRADRKASRRRGPAGASTRTRAA
jgi:uncharacterized protein involved in exopolysaccharide biosynthesis